MTDAELNQNVKLTFYDGPLAATILRLIPHSVKPNHITVARVITSPIVFFLLWREFYVAGLIVFLLVAATDAIDGAMARTRRQITLWGTLYDGVADKFLIGGTVLILVVQKLGAMLAGFVVGLELFGIFAGLYFKRKGIVHPANWWGKIKMNLQVAGVAVLLIHVIGNVPILQGTAFWILSSSIAFGVVSLIAHAKKL